MTTWSAPVRFAEVDQQGVVFNSHYLLYCDEAMAAYCAQCGRPELADRVQLVTTTVTWSGSARWGDTIAVDARCTRVGRTSLALTFELSAGERPVCHVETTYVLTDEAGAPLPVPDDARAALLGRSGDVGQLA